MPISPSPAVRRAGDLLGHLARHPTAAFSVSELARVVGVPRATCDAILQALADHGFVTRNADLRYAIGPGCIALGDAARVANPVLEAAAVEAEALALQTSSCTAVCVRDADEARVAEVFDFAPPFGVRTGAGQSIPIVPPFGAVFVAWDRAGAERWLAEAESSLGDLQLERCRRALDAVRRRGYSVTVATPRSPELIQALETLAGTPDAREARDARDALIREMRHSEYLAGELGEDAAVRLSQMSAPVFDRAGRTVAAIMLLGPEYEITSAELRTLGEQLVAGATRATANAGGRAAHA
jgi:DNA-binding IclR family transcriptional regulator